MISKQNPSTVRYLMNSDRYKGWSDIQNVCYDENRVAQCNNITSVRGVKNVPAPIVMSQFDFNLPVRASVTGLKLVYTDRVLGDGSSTGGLPNIGVPTITITSTGGFSYTCKGEKPSSNFTKHSISLKDVMISREQLNSDDFTVTINYPANTSEFSGGLYIGIFEVDAEYVEEKYHISIHKPFLNNPLAKYNAKTKLYEVPIYEKVRVVSWFRDKTPPYVSEQEIIYYIPPCFRIDKIEVSRGHFERIDDTHVKWTITPQTKLIDYDVYDSDGNNMKGLATADKIVFDLYSIALSNGELLYAEHPNITVNFPLIVYNQFEDNNRFDDVAIFHHNFQQYEYGGWLTTVNINSIPKNVLEDMDYQLHMQTRIWSRSLNEYVKQDIGYVMSMNYNNRYSIDSQELDGTTYNTVINLDEPMNSGDTNIVFTLNGYFSDYVDFRCPLPAGEYEFRILVFYEETLTQPMMFTYPFRVTAPKEYEFPIKPATLQVGTPNMATQTDNGGCTFLCRTGEGFGRWNSNMNGFTSFIEDRYRHIGALKIGSSHHDPKYEFKNPVKEGSWKERKYSSKTGKWEDKLDLKIYLPWSYWKTLEGFVKMDKPVSLELSPRASDDDVLNHRGWVELESISNVERVNPWLYKGDIGVKYLTRKYWARSTIVKQNRVCKAEVPFNLLQIIGKEDYFLDWFDMHGAGQITYDLDKSVVNEINCRTGESLHFRNKWVLKDIDDYKFYWTSILPSESTDASNDYKYNSITYSVLNAKDKSVLLQYTLYDFTTFDDNGEVVNVCNANCTVFRKGESFNVFNRKVKLDWDEDTPTAYGSCTRFEFNSNYLTLTETGANGTEIYEPTIRLDSAEYLLDISFDNNDVGLLEPNFTSTLNVEAYENVLSNKYSNFYEDMLISPFPLTGKQLLFYRKSEEGIIYYYTGESKGEYIINGFEQYKCGVDLQTSSGASVVYIDNNTSTLYLNNNLIKVGFDRVFGSVSFYIYDFKNDEYVYTNAVKISNFDNFELVELNDDKAQIQFGETLWTMWRGHPFIQCEHINTDLRIIDEYDTAECEGLMGADGRILYNGRNGKSEVYLNNTVTSTSLELNGNNAPSFISGETITAKAIVRDNYGRSVNDGKMEFIINGKSAYVDPNPSQNADEDWEWTYSFIPPVGDDDYNMIARFIPTGDFYPSESLKEYYSVHRLPTNLDIKINNSTDSVIDVELGENVVFDINVLNEEDSVNGIRVTIVDLDTGKRVTQGITTDGGVSLQIPYEKISNQKLYEYYVFTDSTDTYTSADTYAPIVRIYDPTNVEVDPDYLNYERDDKNIVFHSDLLNEVEVSVNTDEFSFTEEYSYPIMKAGEYLVTVKYDGDNTIRPYYNQETLTVAMEDVEMNIWLSEGTPEVIPVGGNIAINGFSNCQEKIGYTLYFDGVPLKSVKEEVTFSFFHQCYDAGNHTLQVKFAGDSFLSPAESNIIDITVGQNDSVLRRCNGDIQQYTQEYIQLLDAYDNPIANTPIIYTINGVHYTRITNDEGVAIAYIHLRPNVYPVTVEFEGDDTYLPCSMTYNLTVLENPTVWKTPNTIRGVNGKSAPYQAWSGDSFDGLTGNEYLICGDGLTNTEVITGKDGTYPQPDELRLSNFGFDLPSNAKITKLSVRWYERQTNPRDTKTYPNIGLGSVVLENSGKNVGRLIGSEIPLKSQLGVNSVTVAWNSQFEPVNLNSSAFAVLFKHEANSSTEVGRLWLKYFEVGVTYAVPPVPDIIRKGGS